MRRAARVDGNHKDNRSACRSVGAFVVDISKVGGGCGDLLVAYRGKWTMLENKVKGGKIRDSQRAFHEECKLRGIKVYVPKTPEEALKAIGATK